MSITAVMLRVPTLRRLGIARLAKSTTLRRTQALHTDGDQVA